LKQRAVVTEGESGELKHGGPARADDGDQSSTFIKVWQDGGGSAHQGFREALEA
jgi:hypothetical protein